MKILSLAPLAGPGLEALRALGDLELDPWIDHVPIRLHSADQLRQRLTGVDVLIVEADFIPAEVLDGSGLRALAVCRGDPNNVDIEAATRNDVAVIRTPGRNAAAVADLALGLMLALLRGIVAADDDVRAGRWVVDERIAQQRYTGREIASCTIGLVGSGAVGLATAERVRALGARVAAFDPYAARDALDASGIELVETLPDLFAISDIVSVHAPLNASTRGLIDRDALARARPGTLLVNTARYGIVAEQPLLDALHDGRIAAAAFDHFENEFLPPDHPLASMPNVILTPHIGGTTVETVQRQSLQLAEGLRAVLDGRAHETIVNPDVLR